MKGASILVLLSLICYAVASQQQNITNVGRSWTLFKQCDSRWGTERLGTCSQTVCTAGCAMSSVAMILNSRGWNGNPGTLNQWLESHGGYAGGCEIEWGLVDKLGYTTCMGHESASYSVVCQGAEAGHGIVINVRGGSHWVLVTGCPSGSSSVLNVNDPGFNQGTYSWGDVVGMVVYH